MRRGEKSGVLRERAGAFIRKALRDPRRADIGLYAANGAYYLFLSLGPLTALLLSILPYTPLTEGQLLDGVLTYAPVSLRLLIQAIVTDVYAASPAALSMSLGLELWSGARFLASVVRSVGALSGGGRGYLSTRLMGALYTAGLAVLILLYLMMRLFGERLAAAYAPAARLLPLRGLFSFRC